MSNFEILKLRVLSGRFKSKETDFHMSNTKNQTKLVFYAKCLSRLWLYGLILFVRKIHMFMHV